MNYRMLIILLLTKHVMILIIALQSKFINYNININVDIIIACILLQIKKEGWFLLKANFFLSIYLIHLID